MVKFKTYIEENLNSEHLVKNNLPTRNRNSAQSFKKLNFSQPNIQTVPFKNSSSFGCEQLTLRFSHSGPSDCPISLAKTNNTTVQTHTASSPKSPCFSAWYSTMKSFITWPALNNQIKKIKTNLRQNKLYTHIKH